MKFSDHLWQRTLPIYHKIVDHSFNKELASGQLSQERFRFYIEQDSFYLTDFSKALALIAARAGSADFINDFLAFSLEGLAAERELHSHFLSSKTTQFKRSPACLSYAQYLIATAATASVEEAVAAVLPCFWIYREVGRHIAKHTVENNVYAPWINTYSNEQFWNSTEKAIGIMDEIANQSSPKVLKLMEKSFKYSSLFEWHFWNDAYNITTFAPFLDD